METLATYTFTQLDPTVVEYIIEWIEAGQPMWLYHPITGGANMRIYNHMFHAVDNNADSYINAAVAGGDQRVSGVLKVITHVGGVYIGPKLRCALDANTNYRCIYSHNGTAAAWYLHRIVAGSLNLLTPLSAVDYAPGSSHPFVFQVVDDPDTGNAVLTLTVDGDPVFDAIVDATPITAPGYIAMAGGGSSNAIAGYQIESLTAESGEAEPPPTLVEIPFDDPAWRDTPGNCYVNTDDGYWETHHLSAGRDIMFGGDTLYLKVNVANLVDEPGLVDGHWPVITYQIDDGPLRRRQLVASDASINVAAVDSPSADGTHRFRFRMAAMQNGYDRWGGGYALRVTGIAIAAGKTVSAPTMPEDIWLLEGDSTTEGYSSLDVEAPTDPLDQIASSSAESGWPLQLARIAGVQIGVRAHGSQAYSHASSNGNIPPHHTPDNPTLSAWRWLREGISLLDEDGNLPFVVKRWLSNHGHNDEFYGMTDEEVADALIGWITEGTAATAWQDEEHGPCLFVVYIPFSGFKRAILTSTVAALIEDGFNVVLRDKFTDVEHLFNKELAGPTNYLADDGTHPTGSLSNGFIAGRMAESEAAGETEIVEVEVPADVPNLGY